MCYTSRMGVLSLNLQMELDWCHYIVVLSPPHTTLNASVQRRNEMGFCQFLLSEVCIGVLSDAVDDSIAMGRTENKFRV